MSAALEGALAVRLAAELARVTSLRGRVASLEAQVEQLKLELGVTEEGREQYEVSFIAADERARALEAQVEVMRGALEGAVEHLVGEKTAETAPLGNRMQAAYAVLDNALSHDAHKAAKVNSDGEERCGCGFPHGTEAEELRDAPKRLLDRLRLAEAVIEAVRAFTTDPCLPAGYHPREDCQRPNCLCTLLAALAAYDKQGDAR